MIAPRPTLAPHLEVQEVVSAATAPSGRRCPAAVRFIGHARRLPPHLAGHARRCGRRVAETTVGWRAAPLLGRVALRSPPRPPITAHGAQPARRAAPVEPLPLPVLVGAPGPARRPLGPRQGETARVPRLGPLPRPAQARPGPPLLHAVPAPAFQAYPPADGQAEARLGQCVGGGRPRALQANVAVAAPRVQPTPLHVRPVADETRPQRRARVAVGPCVAAQVVET